jgi:hypothetical protein
MAQAQTFTDSSWASLSGIAGANYTVAAVAVDTSGNTYIGGDFTGVGQVLASHVAKWDGQTWSPLGSGLNGSVYALIVWVRTSMLGEHLQWPVDHLQLISPGGTGARGRL